MRQHVDCVIGGQFGSEGKGAVLGQIAEDYSLHVRVGAANAGHTVYVQGEKHVVQQLPVAAYANPEAALALGPGALLSTEILQQEMEKNVAWRSEHGHPELRLFIDHRAHIIGDNHIEAEQAWGLDEKIGSTSTIGREGIGAAMADRIRRDADRALWVAECHDRGWFQPLLSMGARIADVSELIHHWDDQVLLEGTQGTGLSLTTGFYPFVTSRNTTAAGLLADCGVGPRSVRDIWLVMRTFPIRVNGNSGPFFPDSREITFEDIGQEPEVTTVTKLRRRIATFSLFQAVEAVQLNTATKIALMFTDYIAPDLYEQEGGEHFALTDPAHIELRQLIETIEAHCEVPVAMLGTGPATVIRLGDHLAPAAVE